MKTILVTVALVAVCLVSQGQSEIDLNREFIYKGRQYIPNSPWFTVAFGSGYNFNKKGLEPNFAIDAHFRVMKKHYFNVGFLTSRDQFFDSDTGIFLPFSQNLYALKSTHLTYGFRKEKLNANYALFLGPSINWGLDYLNDPANVNASRNFLEPGLYLGLQATWKFYFDMGIGASLWGSYCKSYQVVGLSVHWYLSTAFKRQV